MEKIIRATDYFQSPVTGIKRNRMRVDYTRYNLRKAVEAIDVTVSSRFIDGSLFEIYFNIWYAELLLPYSLNYFSPPVLHARSTKEKSCIRLREPIQFC